MFFSRLCATNHQMTKCIFVKLCTQLFIVQLQSLADILTSTSWQNLDVVWLFFPSIFCLDTNRAYHLRTLWLFCPRSQGNHNIWSNLWYVWPNATRPTITPRIIQMSSRSTFQREAQFWARHRSRPEKQFQGRSVFHFNDAINFCATHAMDRNYCTSRRRAAIRLNENHQ